MYFISFFAHLNFLYFKCYLMHFFYINSAFIGYQVIYNIHWTTFDLLFSLPPILHYFSLLLNDMHGTYVLIFLQSYPTCIKISLSKLLCSIEEKWQDLHLYKYVMLTILINYLLPTTREINSCSLKSLNVVEN